VAALTAKIKAMAEHMKVHRKDYHSRRGLQAMLNQRRSLLEYLRRKDFDSYAMVLSRLGLKDNYMKLVRHTNALITSICFDCEFVTTGSVTVMFDR